MSNRGLAFLSAFLALLSWLGLGYMVDRTRPTTFAIPPFLFLLFVTLVTTFIPAACYLNHRFSEPERRPERWQPVRQSVWASLFIVLCAWLQLLRVLNWVVASLLLGVFGSIEVFILTRD